MGGVLGAECSTSVGSACSALRTLCRARGCATRPGLRERRGGQGHERWGVAGRATSSIVRGTPDRMGHRLRPNHDGRRHQHCCAGRRLRARPSVRGGASRVSPGQRCDHCGTPLYCRGGGAQRALRPSTTTSRAGARPPQRCLDALDTRNANCGRRGCCSGGGDVVHLPGTALLGRRARRRDGGRRDVLGIPRSSLGHRRLGRVGIGRCSRRRGGVALSVRAVDRPPPRTHDSS